MVVNSASNLLATATPTGTQTFTVVIDPDTALEEIVDVVYPSSPSSNTLTIVRGVDSSAVIAHSAGAKVRHMAIGRDLRDANTHAESTSGTVHGIALSTIVKTSDTSVVTGGMIVNGAVGTAKIDDAAVTEAKIGTSAVSTTKIADSAVTTAKINDSAITSAKIANDTIVNADINSAAAIDKTKISGTAVTQADTGTVTSAMITDGTIVNADINASAAISKSKLNLGGTITSADLVDGTIVASDIADATITAAKMAVDPYARANHTGTQTASTISDFNTAVRTNRLDQMTTPTASVAMGSQKITGLGLATSGTDAVSVNYITSVTGVANGIAPLDGSGKIPTDHLPALAITETFVVNSQANMLALTAQTGDTAVRTDVNKTFILTATPASTLGNWQELLTPTDAVQSVDGSTGAIDLTTVYVNRTTGTLAGNLNASTYKITNLGTPTSNADAATKVYVDTVAGSASAAAASAAAAAASYDSFDDRYLGAKSVPPTLDNDGNALITGAIYWDTVSNAMYAWSGSAWGSISSTAAIYRYRYTATGGETTKSGADDNGVTLSYLPGKEQVYLNGVLLLRTTDYNATSGVSITGFSALTAGDVLEIITFTAFDLATAIPNTIIDSKGDLIVGTAADTAGRLAIGSNGTVLVADSTTSTGLKWSAYDPLPSQSGNNGKYLTTNGSSASWAAITTDPNPSIFMLMGA
jgi:hypothetical protein